MIKKNVSVTSCHKKLAVLPSGKGIQSDTEVANSPEPCEVQETQEDYYKTELSEQALVEEFNSVVEKI